MYANRVPCFEKYYNSYYSKFGENCGSVFRHKDKLVSEDRMLRYGNGPVVAVQRPGQMILTFPKGFHGGYNVGLNVNCAINFACKEWIPYGLRATTDLCL